MKRKKCNIIVEAEACPDHIHMLVEIPPKHKCGAGFVGYLKGKSTLMIFDRHANLKYKYGNQAFLVQRILRRYSRQRMQRKYRNIFRNQLKRRFGNMIK